MNFLYREFSRTLLAAMFLTLLHVLPAKAQNTLPNETPSTSFL
jgi:hypothetical protein